VGTSVLFPWSHSIWAADPGEEWTAVHPFDLKTVFLAKHAQHVVLIHFPIALFIAAVAFDLIAQWTKRQGLADTAYYNLLAEVRHEMVVKAPKSFKISLGCREVCTTF
jgi:hypothetical protein